MPYLAVLFLILNCCAVHAEDRNIINNSARVLMSAVSGKGGITISGGVVISGDTIIASNSESAKKISESKKSISESFDKIIFENISGSVLLSVDNNNEQSVYISASSSVQLAVERYVEDRTLKIFFKEDVATNIPINIYIKAKNIKRFHQKGVQILI